MDLSGLRLRCDFSVGDGVVLVLIWLLLILVTFGLAAFVMPYYILKAPINKTAVLQPNGEEFGHLHVEITFSDILGHMLIWLLLTIVTLGLAYVLFFMAVMKRLLNAVEIR